LYRLEDVIGDMKDVTDMAGVEGTTGAEKGAEKEAEKEAETTKNAVRDEGEEITFSAGYFIWGCRSTGGLRSGQRGLVSSIRQAGPFM
jgi:hypothetical protein